MRIMMIQPPSSPPSNRATLELFCTTAKINSSINSKHSAFLCENLCAPLR